MSARRQVADRRLQPANPPPRAQLLRALSAPRHASLRHPLLVTPWVSLALASSLTHPALRLTPCARSPPGPHRLHPPLTHPLPAHQAHHLVNNGARVNQRDGQGWAPLHRAAVLAHLDGYLELYEYLLVGGYTVEIRG